MMRIGLLCIVTYAAVLSAVTRGETILPMTWEQATSAYELCLVEGLQRSRHSARSNAALDYARRHCADMKTLLDVAVDLSVESGRLRGNSKAHSLSLTRWAERAALARAGVRR